MSRRILQGLRQIADYLGIQGQGANSRRLLLSWISREGLPARRLAGRWYADLEELEAWWSSRTAAKHEPEARPAQERTPSINGVREAPPRGARRPAAGPRSN